MSGLRLQSRDAEEKALSTHWREERRRSREREAQMDGKQRRREGRDVEGDEAVGEQKQETPSVCKEVKITEIRDEIEARRRPHRYHVLSQGLKTRLVLHRVAPRRSISCLSSLSEQIKSSERMDDPRLLGKTYLFLFAAVFKMQKAHCEA